MVHAECVWWLGIRILFVPPVSLEMHSVNVNNMSIQQQQQHQPQQQLLKPIRLANVSTQAQSLDTLHYKCQQVVQSKLSNL